jgi:hypothetical protein
MARHPAQARLLDDLARSPAGATVEALDQGTHGNAAAGRQEFVELRQVVPPWRRFARVSIALRQMDGAIGPIQGVGVRRQVRPEPDLDPGSDSALGRAPLDHLGVAVAFGPESQAGAGP